MRGASETRHPIETLLLASALLLAIPSPAPAREAPPNVVILLADDLGYGDLGAYGHPTMATPNLDRMAREGLKLTSFYSGEPTCTPTRAALLTGRYPNRSGLYRVLFPEDTVGIPESEVTLAEALSGRGYRSMAIGKWHLGYRSPFFPTENGFDSYYGLLYSNDMIPPRTKTPLRLYRDARMLPEEVDQSLLTEQYTEEATKLIRAAGDRPFLLYLAYTMPHTPLHVSERFAGRSRRGLYGDAVETIDWSVGEILRALDEAGLAKDTLVVFTSDNGPALGKREEGGSAGPLRGGKATTYEGGMRVPCILRWPGRIAAGQVRSEPASVLDLLPTLAELAGAELPPGPPLDGASIVPLLEGKPYQPAGPFYYHFAGILEAVRDGKWKLREAVPRENWLEQVSSILKLTNGSSRTFTASEIRGITPATELFDLEADPGERIDVAKDHPEIVERLRRMMQEFARAEEPGPAFDPRVM